MRCSLVSMLSRRCVYGSGALIASLWWFGHNQVYKEVCDLFWPLASVCLEQSQAFWWALRGWTNPERQVMDWVNSVSLTWCRTIAGGTRGIFVQSIKGVIHIVWNCGTVHNPSVNSSVSALKNCCWSERANLTRRELTPFRNLAHWHS